MGDGDGVGVLIAIADWKMLVLYSQARSLFLFFPVVVTCHAANETVVALELLCVFFLVSKQQSANSDFSTERQQRKIRLYMWQTSNKTTTSSYYCDADHTKHTHDLILASCFMP